jgi:hypothetical protein
MSSNGAGQSWPLTRYLPPRVLQPSPEHQCVELAGPVCEGSTTLELMTYLPRAFGHTALHADNGLDGIALASDRKPDLIVCDVQLPGLDGLQAGSLAPRGRLPWP